MNVTYSLLANYIMGKDTELKIKAPQQRLSAIVEATIASKKLYNALEASQDIENIKKLIDEKKIAALKFSEAFDNKEIWPF